MKYQTTVDRLFERTDEAFEHEVSDFLRRIRSDKTRYVRDPFNLLESLLDKYGRERTTEAILRCSELELFSATYVKDYLKNAVPVPDTPAPKIPVSNKKYHITTEKRPIDVYVKAGDSQ